MAENDQLSVKTTSDVTMAPPLSKKKAKREARKAAKQGKASDKITEERVKCKVWMKGKERWCSVPVLPGEEYCRTHMVSCFQSICWVAFVASSLSSSVLPRLFSSSIP